MSRQSKNRRKAATKKAARASSSNRHHLAEGEQASKVPSQQKAPAWLHPSGKKGWWNPSNLRKKKESKNGKGAE